MKNVPGKMLLSFVSVVFCATAIARSQTTSVPKTMTKMVVLVDAPDVPKDSFAAQPKTMYRAGSGFCRTEEAPDPARGIHGLAIVNEPDFWLVNLVDNSAQHAVDPGPTYNCHLPIFRGRANGLAEDQKKAIGEFEFGRELDFFKAHNITSVDGLELQKQHTRLYKFTVGDMDLSLFVYGSPERPLASAWTHGDQHEIVWYSGYGQLDFDPKLFAKPSVARVQER